MKLGAGPQVGLLCSVLKAPEGVSAELERSAVLLLIKCPNSSMVEHTAVNRGVTGSSPVWGALRLRGQEVKTSPFHGGNTGSIPVGVILEFNMVT